VTTQEVAREEAENNTTPLLFPGNQGDDNVFHFYRGEAGVNIAWPDFQHNYRKKEK